MRFIVMVLVVYFSQFALGANLVCSERIRPILRGRKLAPITSSRKVSTVLTELSQALTALKNAQETGPKRFDESAVRDHYPRGADSASYDQYASIKRDMDRTAETAIRPYYDRVSKIRVPFNTAYFADVAEDAGDFSSKPLSFDAIEDHGSSEDQLVRFYLKENRIIAAELHNSNYRTVFHLNENCEVSKISEFYESESGAGRIRSVTKQLCASKAWDDAKDVKMIHDLGGYEWSALSDKQQAATLLRHSCDNYVLYFNNAGEEKGKADNPTGAMVKH